MKKEFSTHWKSSKQPRKQRKYRANAPLHIKHKFLSVNLSKELRAKHKMRNIEVRKGDTVKILRGKFKGQKGKVTVVRTKQGRVAVENIQKQKIDGSKVNIMMQPSNLQILELNMDDKKRMKSREEKQKPKKETTKKKAEEEK